MPRPKKTTPITVGKPAKVQFKGFIDFRVSDESKQRYLAWLEDFNFTQLWSILEDYMDRMYKVSFSFDSYNTAYTATLTCNDPSHPDAGWCLTARGETLEQALTTVIWKDTVAITNNWTDEKQASQQSKKWG